MLITDVRSKPMEINVFKWLDEQIEVFKVVHGFEDINKSNIFKVREANITRGHNLDRNVVKSC